MNYNAKTYCETVGDCDMCPYQVNCLSNEDDDPVDDDAGYPWFDD